MKKLKKALAMILSLAMVLGMTATVFATGITKSPGTMVDSGVPKPGDSATVKITGLTGNPTVTLYKIIAAEYANDGQSGLKSWKSLVDTVTIPEKGETWAPGANDVAKIAQSLANMTPVDTKEKVNATYEYNAEAGAYIAIISGATDGSVYNPVILTAAYNEESAIMGGEVNVAQAVYGESAVAKRTEPEIDKTITGGTTEDGDKETASIGDAVEFTLTPTLPSYPSGALNKLVMISDHMVKGLLFVKDSIKITLVNGEDKVNLNGEFDITNNKAVFKNGNVIVATGNLSPTTPSDVPTASNGFILNFNYDNLIINESGATYQPVITYNAIITDDAIVAGAGNENTVVLHYTNDPNTTPDYTVDQDKPEIPTGDDIQTKTDNEVVYTYQLAFRKYDSKDGDAEKATTLLQGAQFGIYSDEQCKNLVDVVTTNDNGIAISTKVEKGTYWIKELVAPEGYSLDQSVTSIDAQWTTATTKVTTTTTEREYAVIPDGDTTHEQVGYLKKNDPNKNKFYSMAAIETMGLSEETLAEEYSPAYISKEVTTTASKTEVVTNGEGSGVSAGSVLKDIANTSISELPSTGGIGTTIFTIGGCIIMIAAAALFFASRRKKAEN